MDNSKLIILTVAGIILVGLLLLLIQLILRKLKPISEEEGKIRLSYSIWFAMLLLSAIIISQKTLATLAEAVDNISKGNSMNFFGEVIKTTSLFIGLAIIWFIVWYFISTLLSVIVLGNRKDSNEISGSNVGFFIIKGMIVIGFTICTLEILGLLQRAFMPSVQLPIYH